jgi:hypothetical protein
MEETTWDKQSQLGANIKTDLKHDVGYMGDIIADSPVAWSCKHCNGLWSHKGARISWLAES